MPLLPVLPPLALWGSDPHPSLALYRSLTTLLQIDCGGCNPHTVAKAIAVSSDATSIVFKAGQLAVSVCQGVCLNGGQGPAVPPCKDGEDYLPNAQLQLEPCASGDTQGWTRTVVSQ